MMRKTWLAFLMVNLASCNDGSGAKRPVSTEYCWRAISTKMPPSARFDFSMATDHEGKRIFLFGGRNGEEYLNDLWVFDPQKPEWKLLESGDKPAPRSGASLVYVESRGSLILFGGYSSDKYGETHYYRDLWEFSASGQWTRDFFKDGPAARAWHSAAVTNGSVVIFGGYGRADDEDYLNDSWAFDLEERIFNRLARDGGPKMAGRSQFFSCEQGKLLFFGRDGAPAAERTGLWIMDRSNDRWVSISKGDSPPVDYSVAASNPRTQRLLVLSLRRPGEGSSEAWTFSPGQGKWDHSRIEDGPADRVGMVCTSDPTGEDSWFCGGGASGSRISAEFWLLAPVREGHECES